MTVGAIVQARMASTRLPGKVMLEAAGKPLLEHLMERLGHAKRLDLAIVATSTEPQDDVIASLCEREGYPLFRGSEKDVLDRYYQASRHFRLETVVRITSDCPLIDPALVDTMIDFYLAAPGMYDLVTNRRPLTFPDGLDADIIPVSSLAIAWANATTAEQREHTIPFFWQAGMRVYNFASPIDLFRTQRWTLDYVEDYYLIKAIFAALYQPGRIFGMDAILDFLHDHPELSKLNAAYLPSQAALAV